MKSRWSLSVRASSPQEYTEWERALRRWWHEPSSAEAAHKAETQAHLDVVEAETDEAPQQMESFLELPADAQTAHLDVMDTEADETPQHIGNSLDPAVDESESSTASVLDAGVGCRETAQESQSGDAETGRCGA